MAYITKDFDFYTISYHSGAPTESILYFIKGNATVGQMVFYKDGTNIPPSSLQSYGPSIHFPTSRFRDVLEILRHEKPLRLHFNTDLLNGGIETVSWEPTGEEEPVA